MQIALVILHADPSRGGAERYTHDLAIALRDRGMTATVLASSMPADVVVPAFGRTRVGHYGSFCHGVGEVLSRERFDVVHTMLPLAGVSVDLYHPHAGIAASIGSRLGWLTNPRRRAFARAEAGHAADPRATLITLSDYVGRELRQHYPALPTSRTFRLFNGVDIDRFTPDGPRVDLGPGPTVLFVGNDWPRKGLADVIRAMVGVPEARLAVVGRSKPWVANRFARLAVRLGVADRVDWLGPRDDVAALYRSASVFCHASRHDPCSLATLEALASGLPVVGTPTDGATEAMTDGEHGWIVERGNIAPLITDVLEQRSDMAAACVELRPRLSWSTHVDRLIGLYRQLGAAQGDAD